MYSGLREVHRLAIPAFVIYELEVGTGKSTFPRKRIIQLQEITSLVNIISFGQSKAKCAAIQGNAFREYMAFPRIFQDLP